MGGFVIISNSLYVSLGGFVVIIVHTFLVDKKIYPP